MSAVLETAASLDIRSTVGIVTFCCCEVTMINYVWKIALLTVTLVMSACWTTTMSTAFIAPGSFVPPTHRIPAVAASRDLEGLGRAHRALEVLMTAESPSTSRSSQLSAIAGAPATVMAIAASATAPLPALADTQTLDEVIKGGLRGVLDGPIVLALPIFLGFVLATSIAAFIYYFSQPREYDN